MRAARNTSVFSSIAPRRGGYRLLREWLRPVRHGQMHSARKPGWLLDFLSGRFPGVRNQPLCADAIVQRTDARHAPASAVEAYPFEHCFGDRLTHLEKVCPWIGLERRQPWWDRAQVEVIE